MSRLGVSLQSCNFFGGVSGVGEGEELCGDNSVKFYGIGIVAIIDCPSTKLLLSCLPALTPHLPAAGHLNIVVLLKVDSGSPLRPEELLLTLILARRLSPAQSPDLLKEVPGLVLGLLVL